MAERENSKFRERFEYAHEESQYWHTNIANRCYNYYNGTGHYTSAERAILEAEGRPPHRLNYAFKWMNLVSGNERQNRQDLYIYPQEGGDVRMAAVYNYIFDHLKNINSLPWLWSQAGLDGYITGQGWLELFVEPDERMSPDIKIRKVSPRLIYYDPDSIEYDLSDAKDIFRERWIRREELKAHYPKQARDIERWYSDTKTRNNDLYVNQKKEMIRVMDCWYREYTREAYRFDAESGEVEKVEGAGPNEKGLHYRTVPVVRYRRFFGDVVLEDMADYMGLSDFPYTPYFPYYSEGEGVSLMDQLADSQDIINKSFSQFMDILNRQPKVGGIYEEGAIDQPDAFAEAIRNGEWAAVKNMDRIKEFQPPSYPSAHSQTVGDAIAFGRDIMGSSDAFEGNAPGRVEAASGIQMLIQEAVKGVAVPGDNMRHSQRLLGKKMLAMVQKLWSPGKMLRLLGEDGNLLDLEITGSEVTMTRLDRKTGAVIGDPEISVNRLSEGKYDFSVDLAAPSQTQRQRNMNTALMIYQAMPNPALLPLLIEMTDFPNKDEWKNVIAQQMAAGLPQVPGQQGQIPPGGFQ